MPKPWPHAAQRNCSEQWLQVNTSAATAEFDTMYRGAEATRRTRNVSQSPRLLCQGTQGRADLPLGPRLDLGRAQLAEDLSRRAAEIN